MKPNLKKVIIILVVIVILGIAYSYFFVNATPKTPTKALSSSSSTAAKTSTTDKSAPVASTSGVDKDTKFLSTLLNISKIKVDPTIFASPSFNSLQDNNVPIVNNEAFGRPNPFAPFEVVKSEIVNSTPVTTSEASQITKVSAILTGSVSSDIKAESRFFEWGTTTNLGQITALADESLVGNFTKNLTGLSSKTKYYYRATIKVGNVNIPGDILSFTTN